MKKIHVDAYKTMCLVFVLGFHQLVAQSNYVAGASAGTHLTEDAFNTFVGANSGYFDQTGEANAFYGYAAGYYNTASNNTFIGTEAGFSNTTGTQNAYIGMATGSSNQTGSYNTFIGNEAGETNLGSYNTMTGYGAGLFSGDGSYNTFNGVYAGYVNTGSYNVFSGSYAGAGNTSGAQNSFYGYYAGIENTTGSFNTFIGNNAGRTNSTSANNSFFGSSAGYSSTGADNTYIGCNAGTNGTSGYDNSYLGSSSGFANTTGYQNVFLGKYAGKINTTGARNSYMGVSAGSNNQTGNRITLMGFSANVPSSTSLTNATAIGAYAYASASNTLVLGAISGVNSAPASTNVGIGTSAPSYLLHVNGTAAKPGGGTWTVASDSKLKKNIADFTDGLSLVEKIHPVTFQYNGKAGMPTDKKYVGIIAQEMQKIAPYTIGTFTYQDTTGNSEEYLDYDPNAVMYVLVNAIKEQQKQLQNQQTQLDAQQKQISQLLAQQSAGSTFSSSNARLAGENGLGTIYPNPNQGEAHIPYTVSSAASSAAIKIYSALGQEIKSVSVSGTGNSEVIVETSQFAAGTYVCRLVVDGNTVESKNMEVVK